MNFRLFPEQASTIAERVDALYFFLTAMTLFFLAVIFGPMLVFLFKYRRGKNADRSPVRIPMMKIEIVWTVIPLFLAMGIFAWGAWVYFDMQVAPANALEINIVGRQWMWKAQHQEGNREINELHVPVGRPVKLTLASEDVIHSFFIPAFRVKQDVVPGRFVTQWFQAARVGQYHLFCAEYCGSEHSKMIGTVHVLSAADYEEWLTVGLAQKTLAETGAHLFRTLGCSGCHEGSQTVRSPRLEGLYGKLVPLQNGDFVRADDKYIRDSILLPQSQLAAGYEPLMPTFQGRLTEEEVFQLVAYVKSLSNKQPLAIPAAGSADSGGRK